MLLSRILKKQLEVQLLIRINVYDEVTDLKFVGSPNTQKSKYTDNESLLFFQIKKLTHSKLFV